MFQIFLPQVIDLPINREPVEDSGVIPRYSEMKEIVEQMTVNIVKEQLNRSEKEVTIVLESFEYELLNCLLITAGGPRASRARTSRGTSSGSSPSPAGCPRSDSSWPASSRCGSSTPRYPGRE